MPLSIEEIRELLCSRGAQAKSDDIYFEVGKAYFIRTVTLYYTGRVVAFDAASLVLDEAAWVADMGRAYDALRTGSLNEVEPMPGRVLVSRGAIIDAAEWTHKLPSEQK